MHRNPIRITNYLHLDSLYPYDLEVKSRCKILLDFSSFSLSEECKFHISCIPSLSSLLWFSCCLSICIYCFFLLLLSKLVPVSVEFSYYKAHVDNIPDLFVFLPRFRHQEYACSNHNLCVSQMIQML